MASDLRPPVTFALRVADALQDSRLQGALTRATGQLGATALNQLGSAPRLLPNSPLLTTTASP